jgi:hypothetical protein
MQDIHHTVRDYIKSNIPSSDACNIDYDSFIVSLKEFSIDKTIATELVWVILGTVEFFHEDYDTVVEKCSDDLTFKLLQFCINNGADMNHVIQEQNDMSWYFKYPDYNSILDIMYFIAKIRRNRDISILMIVMARCMGYSANKCTITNSDMLHLILSNMTRPITEHEMYTMFKINAIERLITQKQTMPLLDLLFKYTNNISLRSFIDAVEHRDNVACQYYLKYRVDNIDVMWTSTDIKLTSKGISLRLVESLPKTEISSYHSLVGNTLLHSACKCGHEQIVKVLIAKGIDVNAVNRFGETGLFWACKNGNPYIVSHILRKGVNQSYDTLLGYAKRFNRPTVRKVILEYKYGNIWYNKTKVKVLSLIDQFKDVDLGVIQKIVAFT